MTETSFAVAGLDVLVTSAQPRALDDLAPGYRVSPASGGPPGLRIDVERVAGFATGRPRGDEYPAFRRVPTPTGMRVERFDAEGEIDTTGAAVRARFRIGDSPNSLEACVRIAASIALPRVGALVMHSSSVAWGGRAHVFAGVSGAGKSTISTMLADAFPSCTKLTDELTVVRRDPDGWEVHVPPFLGAPGLPVGARAPLAGLCFLVQAAEHRREPMSTIPAVRELLHHVLAYVAEAETAGRVLDTATDVVRAVPCWRLHFRKDPDVGQVLGIT